MQCILGLFGDFSKEREHVLQSTSKSIRLGQTVTIKENKTSRKISLTSISIVYFYM